ncbi:MAG: hypothetical protein ABR936_12555 [Bacteroidota bacterium]|jgi:protein-tyrosine-phosphatase
MKILFICTANICRSVIAEGILKKLLLVHTGAYAIQVQSAGVDALVGITPDRNTSEVCNEHYIDVESHKAQQLTIEMLEETDIVLCMENNQKERILNAFPKYIEKIFLLKNYRRESPVEEAFIEDPIGKSKEHYEECFNEINEEVQRIVTLILSD